MNQTKGHVKQALGLSLSVYIIRGFDRHSGDTVENLHSTISSFSCVICGTSAQSRALVPLLYTKLVPIMLT